MKNIIYLLPLMVFLLSASQCNSTKAQQSDAPTTETAAVENTVSNGENIAIGGIEALLQPNEAGIPYPIYTTYSEIASLLEQEDDKTYVINFWATWCQPCVAELPYFEQLAAETTGQNVQIVMVSLDFQRDMRGKLKRFVENRPFTLPLIALADQDYNSWINLVDEDWQGGIPATVIYKNGKRQFHQRAFPSYTTLLAAVEAVH